MLSKGRDGERYHNSDSKFVLSSLYSEDSVK